MTDIAEYDETTLTALLEAGAVLPWAAPRARTPTPSRCAPTPTPRWPTAR